MTLEAHLFASGICRQSPIVIAWQMNVFEVISAQRDAEHPQNPHTYSPHSHTHFLAMSLARRSRKPLTLVPLGDKQRHSLRAHVPPSRSFIARVAPKHHPCRYPMSVPLINRSLTTIRTELEFLLDSEVITSELHQKLLLALPVKYQKDAAPWGLERLQGDVGAVTAALNKTHIAPAEYVSPVAPPAAVTAAVTSAPAAEPPAVLKPPVHPPRGKPVGFCKALYDYAAQEPDDLALKKDDKIAVIEHLLEDWWKGYPRHSGPDAVGVFPANYVLVISEQEYESSRIAPAPPIDEKAAPPQYDQKLQQQLYSPLPYQPLPQQQPPPPMAQYSPYPPPAANYYPPQQQPQQPQQYVVEGQPQQQAHPHLRKFGGKLGNAAIFGAGATLGSDLVNSIF